MKKSIIIGLFCLPLLSFNIPAQQIAASETKSASYPNIAMTTLTDVNKTTSTDATIMTPSKNLRKAPNLVFGIGYNGLMGRYIPIILINKTTPVVITDKTTSEEKYGKTLNIGLGIGYYGYVGHSIPVIHLNYEFDVAKNFTLAPFISFYSFSNDYYYGDPHNGYRYYSYHETVVPIGVKGTYYFDKLLNAGPKWDFYLAGSLGFAIVNSSWDAGYYGDRNVYSRGSSPLFLDVHIGTEYHISERLGVFLDLSTGTSTIGLAVH